jgi:hypothetical protein
MMSKRVVAAGAFTTLICAGFAQADFTFEFNMEFSGAYTPDGPAPWLLATFADTDTNEVTLTLDAGPLDDNNPTAKVFSWYFNFNPEGDVGDLVFTHGGGETASAVNQGTNAYRADGDGNYDIQFEWMGANVFEAGNSSVYIITSVNGLNFNAASFYELSQDAAGHGPFYAASHVGGLGVGGQDSGWLAPGEVIPLPSGAAMATAGFGLVVLRRRR